MTNWNITCEEVYTEDLAENYIFCTMAELPPAKYIGNDEWVGLDGKHYIVEEEAF